MARIVNADRSIKTLGLFVKREVRSDNKVRGRNIVGLNSFAEDVVGIVSVYDRDGKTVGCRRSEVGESSFLKGKEAFIVICHLFLREIGFELKELLIFLKTVFKNDDSRVRVLVI